MVYVCVMKNSVEADFYKVSCSINNRLSRISDKASLTGKVFIGQTMTFIGLRLKKPHMVRTDPAKIWIFKLKNMAHRTTLQKMIREKIDILLALLSKPQRWTQKRTWIFKTRIIHFFNHNLS